MRTILALAVALIAASAHADDTSWHLMTQTESGTVTLVKNLSKHECDFMMHRARGEPATPAEWAAQKSRRDTYDAGWKKWAADNKCDPAGNAGTSSASFKASNGTCFRGGEFSDSGVDFFHIVQPSDIKSAECFQ